MLYGKVPFMADTEFELFHVICRQPLTFPSEPQDDQLKHLLNRLLDKDPDSRIKLPDLKLHPWTTADMSPQERQTWLRETDPAIQFGSPLSVTAEEVSSAVKVVFIDRIKEKFRKLGSGLLAGLGFKRRTRSMPSVSSDADNPTPEPSLSPSVPATDENENPFLQPTSPDETNTPLPELPTFSPISPMSASDFMAESSKESVVEPDLPPLPLPRKSTQTPESTPHEALSTDTTTSSTLTAMTDHSPFPRNPSRSFDGGPGPSHHPSWSASASSVPYANAVASPMAHPHAGWIRWGDSQPEWMSGASLVSSASAASSAMNGGGAVGGVPMDRGVAEREEGDDVERGPKKEAEVAGEVEVEASALAKVEDGAVGTVMETELTTKRFSQLAAISSSSTEIPADDNVHSGRPIILKPFAFDEYMPKKNPPAASARPKSKRPSRADGPKKRVFGKPFVIGKHREEPPGPGDAKNAGTGAVIKRKRALSPTKIAALTTSNVDRPNAEVARKKKKVTKASRDAGNEPYSASGTDDLGGIDDGGAVDVGYDVDDDDETRPGITRRVPFSGIDVVSGSGKRKQKEGAAASGAPKLGSVKTTTAYGVVNGNGRGPIALRDGSDEEDEKDEEELELESMLFGADILAGSEDAEESGLISVLSRRYEGEGQDEEDQEYDGEEAEDVVNKEETDDENDIAEDTLFVIDKSRARIFETVDGEKVFDEDDEGSKSAAGKEVSGKWKAPKKVGDLDEDGWPVPAWADEEMLLNEFGVNIADGPNRLRKLRQNEDEKVISSTEYEKRLRRQYEKLHPTPAWAKPGARPRRHPDDDDSDALSFGMVGSRTNSALDSTQALFRTSKSLISKSVRQRRLLPSDHIEIFRAKDANQMSPSGSAISSVRFHPTAPVLLTAGLDRTLRLFHIDGNLNPKVQGVQLKDLPIHAADFTADGRTVIMSGRRKYFYVYEVEKGLVERVQGIRGRDEESFEKHLASPCGKFLAFTGRDGYIILVSVRTRQWIANLRMNGSCRALEFSKDGKFLYSIGGDGEVYQWDLATRQCVHRFADEGAMKTTTLAVSPDNAFIATGSGSGVVNVYGLSHALSTPTPKPIKSIMNLTTAISSLQFHPSSQAMMLASESKKDALRVVHAPSLTLVKEAAKNRTPD
ncbi:U3 snoRNP protein [Irineochytrium annulatum]|nr:U3 snoRNP protein [Irineochytrium annulatum]